MSNNISGVKWASITPSKEPIDGAPEATLDGTTAAEGEEATSHKKEEEKPQSESLQMLLRVWHRGFRNLIEALAADRSIYSDSGSGSWIAVMRSSLDEKKISEPSLYSYHMESQREFSVDDEKGLMAEAIQDWKVIFLTLIRNTVLHHYDHWPAPVVKTETTDEDDKKETEVATAGKQDESTAHANVTAEQLAKLRASVPATMDHPEDQALFDSLLEAFSPAFEHVCTHWEESMYIRGTDAFGSSYRTRWKRPSEMIFGCIQSHFMKWAGSFFPRMLSVLEDVETRLPKLGYRPTQQDVDDWWAAFEAEKAQSDHGDMWIAINADFFRKFQKVSGRDNNGSRRELVVVEQDISDDSSVTPKDDDDAETETESPLEKLIEPLDPIDLWDAYDYDPGQGWSCSLRSHELHFLSFIPANAFDTLWLWYGGGPRVEHKMIKEKGCLVGQVKKVPLVLKFDRPKGLSSKHEYHVWPGVTGLDAVTMAIGEMSCEDDRTFWSDLLKENRVSLTKDSYSHYCEEDPLDLTEPMALSEYSGTNNTFLVTRALGPDETKYPRGHCGLSNLGNTCYMNAALQCLINTHALRDKITSKDWDAKTETLTASFKKLTSKVFGGLTRTSNTRDLRDQIALKFPRFANYEQHDSIELVNALLDSMHEEVNAKKKKNYRERLDSDESIPLAELQELFWKDYLENNQSFFAPIFHGQLKSRLECLNCGKVRTVFDAFSCLPLSIDKLEKRSYDISIVDTELGTVDKVRVRIPTDSPLSILRGEILKLHCVKDKGLHADDLDILRKPYHSNYSPDFTIMSPKGECSAHDDYQIHVVRSRRPFLIPLPPPSPPPPPPQEVEVEPVTEAAVPDESNTADAAAAGGEAKADGGGDAAPMVGGETTIPVPDAESSAGDKASASATPSAKVTPKPEAQSVEPPPPVYPSFLRLLVHLKEQYSTSATDWVLYVPYECTRKELIDYVIDKYVKDRLKPNAQLTASSTPSPPPAATATTELNDIDEGGEVPSQPSSAAAADPTAPTASGGELAESETKREPVKREADAAGDDNTTSTDDADVESEEDVSISNLKKHLSFTIKENYGYSSSLYATNQRVAERDIHKGDNAVAMSIDVTFRNTHYSIIPLEERADASLETVPQNSADGKSEATLAKCFERESNTHRVDDEVYCSNCKSHHDAVQEQRVWVLPEVLIIQFKRFHFSTTTFAMKKLGARVEFPVEFDMAPYVIEEAKHEGGTKYHLAGVIHHSGSVSFGHYTATVWNTESQEWVDCDDTRATPRATRPDAELAYILFYQRVSSSAAPPPAPDSAGPSPSKGPETPPPPASDEDPSATGPYNVW